VRGYHCGIIPVDSGMVSRLAPFLGVRLRPGPDAHEQLRHLLQDCTNAMPDRYRELASGLGYRVHIPRDADPTWFVHLVLIYLRHDSGKRDTSTDRPTPPQDGPSLTRRLGKTAGQASERPIQSRPAR
jgi:hypothetical protein